MAINQAHGWKVLFAILRSTSKGQNGAFVFAGSSLVGFSSGVVH